MLFLHFADFFLHIFYFSVKACVLVRTHFHNGVLGHQQLKRPLSLTKDTTTLLTQRDFFVKNTKCTGQAHISLDCAPGDWRYGTQLLPSLTAVWAKAHSLTNILFSWKQSRASILVHSHTLNGPNFWPEIDSWTRNCSKIRMHRLQV